MELLVGSGEEDHLGLVESLVYHLDELLAEPLRGIDHRQTLRDGAVVKPMVAPGGEIVVELPIGELRTQQRSPEVVVYASGMDVAQSVA